MAKSLEQLKKEAAKLQEKIAFIEQSETKFAEFAQQIKKTCVFRAIPDTVPL